MQFRDYYQTLGVNRSDSSESITKAYRKLARKYHPDLNKEPNAEEKFKEINEAYEVIGDSKNRKRYDALGKNWKSGQDFQAPPGWEGMFEGFASGAQSSKGFDFGSGQGSGFSDFFQSLFGGMEEMQGGRGSGYQNGPGTSGFGQRPSPKKSKGQNIKSEITITIQDAYLGATKNVEFSVQQEGRAPERRSYEVKIPKGCTSGKTMRLSAQGGPGQNGGVNGDLLLKVKIKDDSTFRTEGSNIVTTLTLSPWEAALGAEVLVPTLDSQVNLKIPAGSQNGQRLRLKNKGLPKKNNEQGNLYVELKIVVPKELSEKEKSLWEELSSVSSFDARKNSA